MTDIYQHLATDLNKISEAGLYKHERIITTPQNTAINVEPDQNVLNFCANNYLGLADHPALVEAAVKSVRDYGFGMASVRFICGTQSIHKQLEATISTFLETEDTILYSSCWDANGGLFETLLTAEDAIISDALNHASIIDGVRLCKAKRYRYTNNDMADLEKKLREADANQARFKIIATDGVFSMDGTFADLSSICDLADKYNALVMVDDSHAVGFIGEGGRGTPELCGVLDRVDIFTGTFGKALGGGSGGYTSGRKEVIQMLRNRSRPYLFSNSVCPIVVGVTLRVFELLCEQGHTLRSTLTNNSDYFRDCMQQAGFKLIPGHHPIIPIMLGDAKLASVMADKMLQHGVYVVGFSYPVVPMGQARIRVQMSAAHTKKQLDRAIEAFVAVGRELGVLSRRPNNTEKSYS